MQINSSDPSTADSALILQKLDIFFTVIFTFELVLNAYAHWFKAFISDGWSIFDCIVVVLSLAALGPFDIPINVMRSMRAFRVIRLFGRLKILKQIVSSLTASVIPMLSAYFIMLIVTAICKLPTFLVITVDIKI